MTEKQLIELLKSRIKYNKTQIELAKELGVSRSFLSEVLAGKKSIGVMIPAKMGYKIEYVETKKK